MEWIVSDFLSSTCVVNPLPNVNRMKALFYTFDMKFKRSDNEDFDFIPISSGSMSEFYIDPMLTCINDLDIMHFRSDTLAIPEGYSVPQPLPPEFGHVVEVYEFENTRFPCFVLLRYAHTLIKHENSDIYSRESTVTWLGINQYIGLKRLGSAHQHGPAAVTYESFALERCFTVTGREASRCSLDCVLCIRCLVWPPQAAEWQTRPRAHGWPDAATINRIVNHGCDVVNVAHPQCKFDARQWRISFSRAETVLLNSWSPKQQLVYHVLRVVLTIIQSPYNITVIRRYYLKTLMLWACELYPNEWWIEHCVVGICTRLAKELAARLSLGQLPMYFATECNVFDNLRDVTFEQFQLVRNDLYMLNDEYVSWYVINKYIRQCAQLCSPEITRLFNNLETLSEVPSVLSLISKWRQNNLGETSCQSFGDCTNDLQHLLSHTSLTTEGYNFIIEQLPSIDNRLVDYFCSLVFLTTISELERGFSAIDISQRIIGVLQLHKEHNTIDCMGAHNLSEMFDVKECAFITQTLSHFGCKYSNTAFHLVRLSRKVLNESCNTLLRELAKVYLHSSLHCKCYNNSSYNERAKRLVRVILACLYYSTGQNDVAENLCRVVTVSRRRSFNCGNNNRVGKELLPPFDSHVDNALGVIALYQYLLKSMIKAPTQIACVDGFSADIFTHYLTSLCSHNVVDYRKKCEFHVFCYNSKDLMITDILLLYFDAMNVDNTIKLKLYTKTSVGKPLTPQSEYSNVDSRRLSLALMRSAVEFLTKFRLVVSRDFSSVRSIVISDYEAMYAYKCGFFEKCFRLSYNNVQSLLHVSGEQHFSVLALPRSDLLQLVDNDLLSLIGLARLCGAFENTSVSEQLVQLTSACSLELQSKMRLRHSRWTFIDALRQVKLVHDRLRFSGMKINSNLMVFIYRKAILYVRK